MRDLLVNFVHWPKQKKKMEKFFNIVLIIIISSAFWGVLLYNTGMTWNGYGMNIFMVAKLYEVYENNECIMTKK